MRNILKQIKLNESTVSMILGAGVIIIVGLLVVNYFNNVSPVDNLSDGVSTENIDLPTSHVVNENETLWDISEQYYNTGYNWVDIQEANDLTNANSIEKGQTLLIPDVAPRFPEEDTNIAAGEDEATPASTTTTAPEATGGPAEEEEEIVANNEIADEITGSEYTVVRGDTLWDIAVRAYGNGYRWTEIAEANNLANPNIIHSGNVLVLPGK